MNDRTKEKTSPPPGSGASLSPEKRRLFWGMTLLLPVLLLLLLEAGLRLFNYGGNLDLFIDGPAGYENYLRCNPNVGRRYFYVQSEAPTPPMQLFLKQKPSNGYRIFVLGESSAAGFPYGNNASFPNILGRGLTHAFPEKRIEVVNIAMSAVSSYALVDLLDEVLAQSPDALLIYAGHNEYYGALGVGSIVSLGRSPWLVRTSLKLQSVKTFLFFRNVLGWLRYQASRLLYKGSEVDPSSTLMEKIVGEQTIPSGSSLYEAGKAQFRENMTAILQRAGERGVRVILGELVCNLRDQAPFISVEDKDGQSARTVFDWARQLESNGGFEKAKRNYATARDLDALRFRAPGEFNLILKELAEKYSVPLVPLVTQFEEASPHGLVGNNLILEHLHPNREGYFLIAKGFYEEMQRAQMISPVWPADCIARERNQGTTELDSVCAALVVRRLRGSWPFQPRSVPNRSLEGFQPSGEVEKVAYHILEHANFNLESGHMELGAYYEKQGDLDKAFAEYNALVTSIPQETEFSQKAALVLLQQKSYEKASEILHQSLAYRETAFANQWIGQIALMHEDYREAITYLQKANLGNAQVLFNLSRASYLDGQWEKGEEYFSHLKNIAPRSEYFAHLVKMRAMLRLQGRTRVHEQ